MSFFTAVLIIIVGMLLVKGIVHNSPGKKVFVPVRKKNITADKHKRG